MGRLCFRVRVELVLLTVNELKNLSRGISPNNFP